MSDVTNYSKARMDELKGQIATKKGEFSKLIESLTANIESIHQYWVEGDPTAEAVYARLLEQFNQFKNDLNEGYELMTKYENKVDEQIQRYSDAEQQALNAING